MKQYHILKSDSHLNLALMLLKYIVPHLKSESSLKIICFKIYTSDQTIVMSQISFKSEIHFHVSCFCLYPTTMFTPAVGPELAMSAAAVSSA